MSKGPYKHQSQKKTGFTSAEKSRSTIWLRMDFGYTRSIGLPTMIVTKPPSSMTCTSPSFSGSHETVEIRLTHYRRTPLVGKPCHFSRSLKNQTQRESIIDKSCVTNDLSC